MTDTAVGYLRLSQDGKSLERQQRDVKAFASEHGYNLVEIYNEGRRASGFDEDRSKYQALLEHVTDGQVDAVIVPNLSRLSRNRKERLRLLLDLDEQAVQVCSYELERAVDLDDDWELVQQAVTATTDDVGKRKEIERSKRATEERLEKGYYQGRPPFGLRFDAKGKYLVPDGDDYEIAQACIRLREDGHSWREIAAETEVGKDTARRIYNRRQRYLRREK